MKTYISMLRGINVSGQKKIKMKDLKKLYEVLEFSDVETYIQSGNVVFKSSNTDISGLITKIQKKIQRTFGFDVSVLIRTKDELQKLIENTPFSKKDTSKLHITFLSDSPIDISTEEINNAKDKAEEFSIASREIYLFCPNGYGKSKLSNTFFERKLGVSATTRNWKTVNTLFDMAK